MNLTKLYKVLANVNVDEVLCVKNFDYRIDACAQFITQFFYEVDQRFGDCVLNILYDDNGHLRKDLFLDPDEDGFEYFKLNANLVNKDNNIMFPRLDNFDNMMITTMLLTQFIIANYDEDYIVRLHNNNPTSMVLPFSMALLLQEKFINKTHKYQDVYLFNTDMLNYISDMGKECFDYEQKMKNLKKIIDKHRVDGKIDARHFYSCIVPLMNDCIVEHTMCSEDTQLILGYLLAVYNSADHKNFLLSTKSSITSGFIDAIEKNLEDLVDKIDLSEFTQLFCDDSNKRIFNYNKQIVVENTKEDYMKSFLLSLDDNLFKIYLEELKKEDEDVDEDDDECKFEDEHDDSDEDSLD